MADKIAYPQRCGGCHEDYYYSGKTITHKESGTVIRLLMCPNDCLTKIMNKEFI